MQTDNEHEPNLALVVDYVLDLQNRVDIGDLKQLTMDLYQNAQASEIYNTTAEERFTNFYNFKLLYNFLLKLEMQFQPGMTGVNLM